MTVPDLDTLLQAFRACGQRATVVMMNPDDHRMLFPAKTGQPLDDVYFNGVRIVPSEARRKGELVIHAEGM